MNPTVFQRIHDDSTDREIDSKFFQFTRDAYEKTGASNVQKIILAIHRQAYGACSDHMHDYTGVQVFKYMRGGEWCHSLQ